MSFNKSIAVVALLGLVASISLAADKKVPLEKATFAAGCFWCTQPAFDQAPGVVRTQVGYTGGHTQRPTYEEVSSGSTGHAESIEILYDPAKTSYEKLLDVFWHNIDPTTLNQQFPDQGTQYRTVIFYHTEGQRKAAIASKEQLEKSKRFNAHLVTAIEPAGAFWPAEDHHQKYYCKRPGAYKMYHDNSGREGFFKRIWGK